MLNFRLPKSRYLKTNPGLITGGMMLQKLHYTCVRIILPERITWAMEMAMDQQ